MVESSSDVIKVIHVDDDRDLAEMTAEFLEREDGRFSIETATSAGEGLDKLATTDYDCVISDYQMPGQDGIAFLETIREKYPRLPFILYTGKGSEEVASEAIAAGATDYLQKGRGTDQYELLANRTKNAIEQYRASRRAANLRRIRTIRSEINQALLRSESRSEAETRVCEIITESDSYLFAWIGEVDPETQRLEPRAWAGVEEDYLENITVTADDTETGHGPGGTALRERRVAVSQNVQEDPDFEPWREAALERGYQSLAAVPLEYKDRFYGALGVYSERPHAFDDDETALLEGLAADMASAFHSFEIQQMLREERNFTEEALDAVEDIFYVITPEGALSRVNDQVSEVTGYSETDIEAMNALDFFPEDEREQITTSIETTIETGSDEVEAEIHTANGTRIPYEFVSRRLTNSEGEILGIAGIGRDLTDWKAREQELRETKRRLDLVLEGTETGIWSWNMESDEVEWNETLERAFGLEPGSFEGTYDAFAKRVHPDDLPQVEAEIERAIENDEPYHAEFRMSNDEADIVWAEAQGLIIEEEAEPDRMVGLFRAITERKERETRLRALNERTHHLVAADTREQICEIGVEAASEVLGLDANAIHLYADDQAGLVPVAGTDAVYDLVGDLPVFTEGDSIAWRVYDSGETLALDDVHDDPDIYNPDAPVKSELYLPLGDHGILIAGSEISDAFDQQDVVLGELLADAITAALGHIQRTDQLRAREAELEETNTLLSTLFETLPVGATVLDTDGTITRANQRAEDVLGLTESEITERTYDDPAWRIIDEEGNSIPAEDLPFARVIETGETVLNYEHGIRWPDGTERWLSINATPLTTSDGAVEQVVAVITDITDQRTQEQALKQQNEQLDQFASIVSHDLRNPLTVAEGRLELAQEECESEHLDDVGRALARMNVLIDDLMTLAHEGDQVGELEPVDVATLTGNCWQNVATVDATLTVEIDRRIQADQSRLQQLLENLMRNTVEHGGEDVTITVGELDDGFYVEDDGPGIPEDKQDDVFEAGYSTSADGTGFGLSIVKQVAQAHEWEVGVTDGSEGGARFEITGVEFAAE